MAIVIFPKLDKKNYTLLAFIIIGIFAYIGTGLIKGIAPFNCKYFDQICQFLPYIPFFIIKIIKKKGKKVDSNKFLINKENPTKKFTKIDYIIFAIIAILDLFSNSTYVFLYDQLIKTYLNFNRVNIQMILMIFFSKLYSQKMYYSHRLISQFIITILTTLIDFIVVKRDIDKYSSFTWFNIMAYLITTIIDAIVIAYKQYLLIIKFISVEVVSSLFGIFNVIFMTLLIILIHYFKDFFCNNNEKCPEFINFKYETFRDWIVIILSFFFISLFFLLYYKSLKDFTPNHILLTFIIYIFFSNVLSFFEQEDNKIYLVMLSFIFIIIFICFLVYLEIMELNFCELNKYTRRNIIKREEEENKEINIDKKEEKKEEPKTRNSSDNEVFEVDGGYLCDINYQEDNEERNSIN